MERLYKFVYWKDEKVCRKYFGSMWEMFNYADEQENISNHTYNRYTNGEWTTICREFY